MIFGSKALLRRFKRSLRSGSFRGDQREWFAKLLGGRCPIGCTELSDHTFAMLAVVPIPSSGLTEGLVKCLLTEEWTKCAKLSQFEPTQDLLEAFLIRCPDSALSWVLVHSPVEYLEHPSIVEVGSISDEGQQRLEDLAADLSLDWKSIPASSE